MKFTKFSKYTGEPADAIDLEELIKKLGDFFLQSGFESQFYGMDQFDPERSMEALREAILRALQEGDLFDENSLTEEMRQMLQRSDAMNNEEIRDLIDKLMERMAQEGFINPQQPPQITPPNKATARGSVGKPMDRNQSQVRFEITDKTIDFLGFKNAAGFARLARPQQFRPPRYARLINRHRSGGVSRAYEFGDTLNLDVSETLFNAVRPRWRQSPRRNPVQGPHGPPVRISFFLCHGRSSRLQPQHDSLRRGPFHSRQARRHGALASHSNAISRRHTQSRPLHDSAEEVPLSELARVQVGPFYTNTREGLRIAQRILLRQRKDMRQIVMITDGKPSALTLEDGRIYKNAFGLDPFVVGENARRSEQMQTRRIMINTSCSRRLFPRQFRQKITQMCKGKAYFTTPTTSASISSWTTCSAKPKTIH